MSRIGKAPVTIPSGVEVTFTGNVVKVKGKKGELHQDIDPAISISIEDNIITFTRSISLLSVWAYHGRDIQQGIKWTD
jgi:large subunit ribosomal protein L6